MQELPLAERRDLGQRIRKVKQAVAEKVTDEFLARHPDWRERYGDGARSYGIEDACYHLDFLAAALEGGAVSSFEDYCRWTARVLQARGIGAHFVAENLQQLAAALQSRLPAPCHPLLRGFIAAGCAASLAAGEPAPAEAATPLALSCRMFLQAILAGQREAALNIAREACRAGHDIRDLYVEVFQEALYEVGRLWEANRITVAEEHMATAITQYVVTRMYEHLPQAGENRGRAVIAGVRGELHQVGAHMVSDMLDADGWDVRFLGTNMPEDGILKTVREHRPEIFGLSVTMLFNLPQVMRLVETVRRETGSAAPHFLLGGAAFRRLVDFPAELRVDAVASDLRQGVALARRFQR